MGSGENSVKSVKLIPNKLSTTYNSGKFFKVKAINGETKNAASNVEIFLKIYTKNKHKTISVKTDSNGIAKYPASKLPIGKHKVILVQKLTLNQKIA